MPNLDQDNQPLLLRLKSNRITNALIKRLYLPRLADMVLRRFPLSKHTPGGFRYKLRSVSSMVGANEIFGTAMYQGPLRGEPIRRFVDLGCNVGYFPILLGELTHSRDLEGLMIDGNQLVVDEAKEHLRLNGFHDVDAVLGLAGFADAKKEAEFLVNPFHIASTATGKLRPDVPVLENSVKIIVPCLNVEQMWIDRFGDVPIDLLKVDIEGMELELFRNAPGLLARSSRVLFEWHKWQVSFSDCCEILADAGFEEPEIVAEDSHHGVAFCHRLSIPLMSSTKKNDPISSLPIPSPIRKSR
jgi:FkbM family methyltransferase